MRLQHSDQMANVPLASLHCLRSELTSCSPGQIETNDQLSFWSLLYNVKQQDPTLCRICLDEQPLDALVSVCLCAGSMKYVHRHCIQCWLNKRINEQEETEGPVSLACQICHYPICFLSSLTYQVSVDCAKLKENLHTVLLLGLLGLLTLSALFSYVINCWCFMNLDLRGMMWIFCLLLGICVVVIVFTVGSVLWFSFITKKMSVGQIYSIQEANAMTCRFTNRKNQIIPEGVQ